MQEPAVWAERVRDAVLAQDRRRRQDGNVMLLEARVEGEYGLEFSFTPIYLGRRLVVLTVDGRRKFAADFLVDEPDEEDLLVKDWPVPEAAWRISLLGMHEPFDESELVLDARGRWVRPMTE